MSNQVRMRIISQSINDITTSMSLALSISALCISLMQSVNGTQLLNTTSIPLSFAGWPVPVVFGAVTVP